VSDSDKKFTPGLTFRSLCAIVFCLLLAAMYTQYSAVILVEGNAGAEQVLPIPAMTVLLLLLMLCGSIYALGRTRLLSRAEMVCVFFTMIIAVPIMTQGMWHRFLGLISSPPRTSSFDYIDAYSDRLWPNGPNLLANHLTADVVIDPDKVARWQEVEYQEGVFGLLPVLENSDSEQVSVITLIVPAGNGPNGAFIPVNPHLFSVLARTEDTGTESMVFCRVYEDDSDVANELVSARRANRPTFIHKKGFVRLGTYGARFSHDCRRQVRIELGLSGRGRVVFADPKLMSVAALEGAFRGRRMISESQFAALVEDDRSPDMVIKPDNMWSLRGLRFLVTGYIPLREWVGPAAVWSSFILLVVTACFAINVIMHKQWANSERYPFPNARIPLYLLGGEDEETGRALPAIWYNRYAWAGFAVALFWGLMKGWHVYNRSVPDMSIEIPLAPYFQDPSWGGMWNATFSVSMFFVSIAIFFELNVLISLVLGFWFYRSFLWFGQISDMRVHAGYPWRYQQAIGGYVGYFLICIFFTRKYLWQIFMAALRGTRRDEGDILSSRAALLLLVGCMAGALLWGRWIETSLLTIGIYFCFLLIIGFVSAKFRAECGLPGGYFTPYNAMLLFAAMGGMAAFGSNGILVALLLSGFLTVSVFFFIPGAQLEMMEIGRRLQIQPRHITYTCLLGVLGGVFIGGWVFLSNAYAIGGDNIKFQWAFNGLSWFFGSYKSELANTTTTWLQAGAGGTTSATTNWPTWTMFACGGFAAALTIVRQFFAGFWFHPIGFILGSSHLLDGVWGSLLVAWIIRFLVLKIGGATSVRSKLQPFFVGAFVGSVVVMIIFMMINSAATAAGSATIYSGTP